MVMGHLNAQECVSVDPLVDRAQCVYVLRYDQRNYSLIRIETLDGHPDDLASTLVLHFSHKDKPFIRSTKAVHNRYDTSLWMHGGYHTD